MKKNIRYMILFLLLVIFILLFRYNSLVKTSILSSMELWLYNLVPFMLPMYLITDLLLNYGLGNVLSKIFKSNQAFLIAISMLLGTPSNAKYISEFYKEGYISIDEANWLLGFCYSPNPLFILGISNNFKTFSIILTYLYLTNFVIAFITKSHYNLKRNTIKKFEFKSFSKCLEDSIYKSFHILILILGITAVYGVLNSLLDMILPYSNIFFKSLLELTNALHAITKNGYSILWMMFAISFSGLSIHTQIKSILEDTPLKYKNFLLGRLFQALPLLIIISFY